jgi:MraZ protein
MSTFFGTEICAIDAKGRLNVPARMRRGLDPEANDSFVIVRGFEGCVNMYPRDEWDKYDRKLRELNGADEDARNFARLTYESAHETTLDGQGRVSLTAFLMEYAGVTKEAKLIGIMDRIEIWNPKKYGDLAKATSSSYEALARRVFS